MVRTSSLLLTSSIFAALLGCGERAQERGAGGAGGAGGSGGAFDGQLPAAPCNPLGAGDCLLPFPSSHYLRADTASATGWRVDLRPEQLPKNTDGKAIDVSRWNLADGFSPAAFATVLFPERVDPGNLPGHADPERSLEADSPTALLELPSGRRLLHFAEVDANYKRDDRQALLIRPLERPASRGRFAVVLRRSLRGRSGQPLPMPEGFRAIVEGRTTSNEALERLRPGYAEIFAAAAQAGIPREDILLAWEYRTASDDFLLGNVRSMRDQALAMAGGRGDNLPYAFDSMQPGAAGDPFKLFVRGHFRAPLFLTAMGKEEGKLSIDEHGRPALQGTYDVPFSLVIPKRVDTDGPLPLMVYGHGILGSSDDDGTGPFIRTLAEEAGYIIVATDWTGLTEFDYGTIVFALGDFTECVRITDKLQQSIVNTLLLTKLARGVLADDPVLQAGGRSLVDTSRVVYQGTSLGGIQGVSFLGWSPDITRGSMNVSGGNWSLLIERSTHWHRLALILSGGYEDAADQQKLVMLLQAQLDFSDPINARPLFDGTPKQVLLQESIGDAQVSNLASEMLARALGLPMLAPSVRDPGGMESKPGPLPAALTIWDLKPEPMPPATNQHNNEGNGAHEQLRFKPAARRQSREFLLGSGQVTDQCGGQPCDCSAGRCD